MHLKRNVIVSTIILSLFGLVMIYSASSYSAELKTGDAFFYVKKQLYGFIAGLVMMLMGYKLKKEWLKKARWIIYAVSMILLLILFIPGVGQESYGATRWLNLGFITLQSSEIAKFGLVIFLAGYMDDHPPTSVKGLIVPVICGLSMCVAVMLEPNMSITIVIGASLMVMLFVGGIKRKHIWVAVALVCIAIPVLIILEPYRVKRLVAFIDPWANPKGEGYQLIQSYYALGSGGLFGVGLFNSRQKYLYLPFAESDFIFSVIGEELGLLGCVAVLAVFAVLIFSGIKISVKAEEGYTRTLAAGITAVIAIQTLLNVAVVSGLVPPTGVPLPYVSAGGSSLMVFCFSSGLLAGLSNEKDGVKVWNFKLKEGKKGKLKGVSAHTMS
ncbi:MAG: putative lipid II flippase FtsW [Clostridia bacterium]|nr:putative lipid II flippase FtsW [Clostridia bacterium]